MRRSKFSLNTNHAISAAVSDGWFSLNTLTGINISTVTITANGDNAFEIHEDQANAISRQWSLRCIAGGSGSIHVENPATLPDDFSVTCTDDRDEDDVGAGN